MTTANQSKLASGRCEINLHRLYGDEIGYRASTCILRDHQGRPFIKCRSTAEEAMRALADAICGNNPSSDASVTLSNFVVIHDERPKVEVRINTNVPEKVLRSIERHRHGKFSDLVHIFHCIQIDMDTWVGVAGDGGNGCYEYFVMDRGQFTCTDCGYGGTDIALRDVLNKELK